MLARNSEKMRYEAGEIEAKWQQSWEDAGVFKATRDQSKPKYYVLEMFPLSFGADPYGARAQLHDGRCDCPP
jgi:isoleucyl-tRNA synthetase